MLGGGDARGREGFRVWHCRTARVGVRLCPLRLTGRCWHRALQHCGLPVLPSCPGVGGATEPQPTVCLTPPAPACQGREGSGVWCEWAPGALEPSQTAAEAGGRLLVVFFFFLEKRRLCSALPLPWACGSSGAEQRILVLQGRPHVSGCCAAAESRSSGEVRGASARRLSGQRCGCVRPCCGRFFSKCSGPFGFFWSLLALLFLNKTFKLNLVRWC